MNIFDAVKKAVKNAVAVSKETMGENYKTIVSSFSLNICYRGDNKYSAEACFEEDYNMTIMTDSDEDIQKLLSLDNDIISDMVLE